MNIKTHLTAFAFLTACNVVYAADIYKTGFENSPFVAGTGLVGTDGWIAPGLLNPNSAIITNTVKRNGLQSVVVPGASLLGSGGQTGPYDAIGSYRHPLSDADKALIFSRPIVKIEADLQIKTAKPRTPGEFFSLTIAARADSGETMGEIGLSSQGVAEAWLFETGAGNPADFTRPIRFNGWYHIKMVYDSNSRILTYYVNDNLLGSTLVNSALNVLQRGAMVVYARPNGGDHGGVGSDRANYTAYFDNFRISADDD